MQDELRSSLWINIETLTPFLSRKSIFEQKNPSTRHWSTWSGQNYLPSHSRLRSGLGRTIDMQMNRNSDHNIITQALITFISRDRVFFISFSYRYLSTACSSAAAAAAVGNPFHSCSATTSYGSHHRPCCDSFLRDRLSTSSTFSKRAMPLRGALAAETRQEVWSDRARCLIKSDLEFRNRNYRAPINKN